MKWKCEFKEKQKWFEILLIKKFVLFLLDNDGNQTSIVFTFLACI